MVQVTVYAGAIVVLFLFVIMLLGAERLRGVSDVQGGEQWQRVLSIILAAALLGVFVYMLFTGNLGSTGEIPLIDASPQALGLTLFERYILPFELTGALLLAAIIGVVVLGRSKKGGENVK
jgi:NADH-quinone oxidoreductase subunit J